MIVINGIIIIVSKMTSLQTGQVRNRHLILSRGKKFSYSPKLLGCETDHRPASNAKVHPSVAKLKKILWLAEWGTFLPQNTISVMYIP